MPIIHNKSDRPDNIVSKNNDLLDQCRFIESQLPSFMQDYFIFLRSSVSVSTRLSYLQDIQFFLHYLSSEKIEFMGFKNLSEIPLSALVELKARDINYYLGEYCVRYERMLEDKSYIFSNDSKSLARKKSSLSTLFKFLYRNEQLPVNITDGFNPIKLPKPQPDAIKKLDPIETVQMLRLAQTGDGFTEKEKQYWKKTCQRDYALLLLFVTYGLRLSELEQLNLSSFHFGRQEFKIYRKRGKESLMPLNHSILQAIQLYIENERKVLVKGSEVDSDALFLSLQGTRLNGRSIRNLVKKYTAVVLGTSRRKGYSPHKLRATAASALIEQGFSIYDVKHLLDHENVTTTQLYAAHRKNLKQDVISQFNWEEDV